MTPGQDLQWNKKHAFKLTSTWLVWSKQQRLMIWWAICKNWYYNCSWVFIFNFTFLFFTIYNLELKLLSHLRIMGRIYRLAFGYSMAKNNTLHIEKDNEHLSLWGSGHPSLFRRWIICVILLTGHHFWLGIKMLNPRFIYSNNALQKRISFFSPSRKNLLNSQTHKHTEILRLHVCLHWRFPPISHLSVLCWFLSDTFSSLKRSNHLLKSLLFTFLLTACPNHQFHCL